MFEQILDEISTATQFGRHFVSLRTLEKEMNHPKNYYSKTHTNKRLSWLQRNGIIFILNGAMILNAFCPDLANKSEKDYTAEDREKLTKLMRFDEDKTFKRSSFVNLTFMAIEMLKYKSKKFNAVIDADTNVDLTSLLSKSINYRGNTPSITNFIKGRGR
ncbi:MAG: hypothetical protein GF364_19795, partial [Candidatus Lokiarchaeota archaeon]|nr:hypothetical protein [Candidatus Lokiarchaeota archaeon]